MDSIVPPLCSNGTTGKLFVALLSVFLHGNMHCVHSSWESLERAQATSGHSSHHPSCWYAPLWASFRNRQVLGQRMFFCLTTLAMNSNPHAVIHQSSHFRQVTSHHHHSSPINSENNISHPEALWNSEETTPKEKVAIDCSQGRLIMLQQLSEEFMCSWDNCQATSMLETHRSKRHQFGLNPWVTPPPKCLPSLLVVSPPGGVRVRHCQTLKRSKLGLRNGQHPLRARQSGTESCVYCWQIVQTWAGDRVP